jgi:molybdopterin-synthase adenylyltransferase
MSSPSGEHTPELSDAQLLRYSRHVLLNEVGTPGQTQLLGAHAVIVGAGGLGSPAALYLASAGVGRITVLDDDVVDASNLQRQIAHRMSTIGLPKVQSIALAMAQLNPDVQVHTLQQRADASLLKAILLDPARPVHVVLDCCDNFVTRHAINRACVSARVPLVSGAAIRFDGQVSVFDSRQVAAPCYACLFPSALAPEEARCATLGVFAPLTGIIGATQAAEALKLIMNTGASLAGRLLLLNALSMRWDEIKFVQNTGCTVCST